MALIDSFIPKQNQSNAGIPMSPAVGVPTNPVPPERPSKWGVTDTLLGPIGQYIIKPALRTSAALALTAKELYTGKPASIPANPLTREVFGEGYTGEKPGQVLGFTEQQKRADTGLGTAGAISSFAKSKGVPGVVSTPLAVLGLGALDITPAGGETRASGKAVQEIAGSLTRRYTKDVAEEVLGALARNDKEALSKLPTQVVNDISQSLSKKSVPAADILPKVTKTFEKQIPTEVVRTGTKQSKLVSSIQKSPVFEKKVADQVAGETARITNAQSMKEGKALIDEAGGNLLLVRDNLLKKSAWSPKETAAALLVSENLQKQGMTDLAVDFIEKSAERATQSGQMAQAWAMWGRLTPAGATKYTISLIDRANELARGNKVFKTEIPGLSKQPELAKAIVDQANKVQKFAEGTRERIVETAKLQQLMVSAVPPSLGQKISSIQTMAQLLNAKTVGRNLIGNLGFGMGLENVSQSVARAIDLALPGEKATGSLPSFGTQIEGLKKGFAEGAQDVKLGIDTANLPGQVDLPRRSVWTYFDKAKGELAPVPVLGQLEKTLGYTLRAPDRAFFKAAYDEGVRDFILAAEKRGLGKSPELAEAASVYGRIQGLRRTFQDENVISKALSGLKRTLNFGKDFGIGDFVIKYPKTPGAILARGLEYSPAAFADMAFDLVLRYTNPDRLLNRALKGVPLSDSAKEVFGPMITRRYMVEKGARAITGSTALAGTGAILGKLGIVTAKNRTEDSDLRSFQKTYGIPDYSLNVDALKRFVTSGLDPSQAKPKNGDQTVSYDWLQPMSMPFILGAELARGDKTSAVSTATKIVDMLSNAIGTSSEVLAEQPVLRGFGNLKNAILFKDKDESAFGAAVRSIAEGIPASFVPSLIAQTAYVIDPKLRDPSSQEFITQMVNNVLRKIPGVSSKLPPVREQFGEPVSFDRLPQGSRSTTERALQSFLSPAKISYIRLDPEVKLVLDLVDKTGENDVVPRVIPTSQQVGDYRYKLTAEQRSNLQRIVGTAAKQKIEMLSKSAAFQVLSDEKKAEKLSKELSNIYNTAKLIPFFQSVGVVIPKGENMDKVRMAWDRVSSKMKDKSAKEKAEMVSKLLNWY